MNLGRYIAIDWGTTNRRVWLVGPDGAPIDHFSDDHGVLKMQGDDYKKDLEALRSRWGDIDILIAGMAGSPIGMAETPYLSCPSDLPRLASGLFPSPVERCLIVPGVALDSERRCDVMRGEEVLVLGAISAGLAPETALFCQPGTHCKWIRTKAGKIIDFMTVMTGELYERVESAGVLSGMMNHPATPSEAFLSGVENGVRTSSLAAALFEIRAMVMLGKLKEKDVASSVSGVLIGNDLACLERIPNSTIHLVGTGTLTELYRAALSHCGRKVAVTNSNQAFLAGLHEIRKFTL